MELTLIPNRGKSCGSILGAQAGGSNLAAQTTGNRFSSQIFTLLRSCMEILKKHCREEANGTSPSAGATFCDRHDYARPVKITGQQQSKEGNAS